jgi:glutathione S-transferase
LQPTFEYRVVPGFQFEEGGKMHQQYYAILRLLGKKFGYYPKDDKMTTYNIDNIMEGLKEPYQSFGKYMFTHYFLKQDASEFAKTTQQKTHAYLKVISARLEKKEAKGFLVGYTLSIADFAMLAWFRACLMNPLNAAVFEGIIDQYPLVKQYSELLQKHLEDILLKIPTGFIF